MRGSPGARAYYPILRERGTSRPAPTGNRLVGILHGWLETGTAYNQTTAWAHIQPTS